MENSTQIAKRFRDVFLSGKWIANTNYKLALEGLSWEQATQKVETLNSIALLAFHVNYYIAGIVHVFNGGPLDIRDKYSFDLPPIQSQEDWEQLVQKFLADAEQFASHLEQMTAKDLDAPFVKPEYGDYRRNIEGMIEHGYYHLGQVVILRKLLTKAS